MNPKRGLTALAVLGVMAAGAAAVAQEQAQNPGVVGVRQNAMRASAAHMGAVKKIVSEYPQLLPQVEDHAVALASLAEHTPELFPEGSDKDGSKALPAAWSDKAGLEKSARDAQQLAQKLGEAAKGGDARATLVAFGELGKNGCGGCHQTYRQKQQQ
jgi:cytochrome c556